MGRRPATGAAILPEPDGVVLFVFARSHSHLFLFLFRLLASLVLLWQALKHKYMESLHNPEDEPVCDKVFDFAFEQAELDKVTIQELIFEEACAYHPEARPELDAQRASRELAAKPAAT